MPASNFLVGTAPDQVPTNADLGEMAFQSKDAVEFTGGKGGLSHLDITAISAQLNVNATDVFVYDTSKDSDGGAWRNRCQHTSWFNETLNTATRGARREFPSVAVIVATTTSITIYDGDDPALPMWMVFNTTDGSMLRSGSITSISMLNGELWVGHAAGSALHWINFLKDAARWITNSSSYGGFFIKGYISVRNQSGANYYNNIGGASDVTIAGSSVNDVAMTVLPNAPIDAATGLPVPTIAVATSDGVSIIHNTGVVANIIESGGSAYATVAWTPTYGLLYSQTGYFISIDGPNVPQSGTTSQASMNNAGLLRLYQYDATIPAVSVGWQSPLMDSVVAMRDRVIALDRRDGGGLALLAEAFEGSRANGMVDWVTSKYNTGWMPGDIKGAWLSDTTQETMVGAELITNGTFQTDTSGWTISSASEGSIAVSNGQLVITNSNTSDPPVFCWQAISTVVGSTYTLSADLIGGTVAMLALIASTSNTTAGTVSNVASSSATTLNNTFTATASTMYVLLRVNANSVGTVIVDNVSCRLASPDRSVNGKGLQLYGSVAKTPVASGADLVSHSLIGGSYFNYPSSTLASVLAGNHTMSFWVYMTGNAGAVFELHGDTGYTMVVYGGNPRIYSYYAPGAGQNSNNWSLPTSVFGRWANITITKDGGVWRYYIDGAQNYYVSGASFTNFSADAKFAIGRSQYFGYFASQEISLALFRVSANVASHEQIRKMYEDEKYLFQDNAKATLYGTSDAVTALAYDEDTQLLHVGTSSGRSVFDGLRRVDNTTTAVSATISAANGLVVEN